MKTRNLLLTGLIGLGMLSACSNEDDINQSQPDNDGVAYAQIAITIAGDNSAVTKAPNGATTGSEDAGDESEYKIDNVQVIGVNPTTYTIAWIKNISNADMKEETDGTDAKKDVRATKPFLVPTGSYRIYVIANAANSGIAYGDNDIDNTNITDVIDISNASQLSIANNFVMTNATVPDITYISATQQTYKEFDDDGKEESGENVKNVIKVEAGIQRVVGKIEFDGDVVFNGSTQIGKDYIDKVTINGVAIVNLNKKMNLVMNQTTVEAPAGVSKTWYYPTDPNYDYILGNPSNSQADANWIANNFTQSITGFGTKLPTFESYSGENAISIYYAPENTMSANAQQRGQTTGVLYKTTVEIATDKYTTLSSNGGSSPESKKFEEICKENYNDISGDIFTTCPSGQDDKTFYSYNGLVFISRAAAALFQAIVESSSTASSGDIYTQYQNNNADTNLSIKEYQSGVCYYLVWIKHNPDLEEANAQNKYGVVRNHWYVLEVTKINDLGYSEDEVKTIEPEDPDDPKGNAEIQVLATIKPWTIVKQNVELQ